MFLRQSVLKRFIRFKNAFKFPIAIFLAMALLGSPFGTLNSHAKAPVKTPSASTNQALNQPIGITSVKADPKTGDIKIIADQNFANKAAQHYSVIKLPAPNRLVIDIPDAQLMAQSGTTTVGKNGIKEIEISQQQSAYYKAVRVVVYVDDAKNLWALNTELEQDTLVISPQDPTLEKPTKDSNNKTAAEKSAEKSTALTPEKSAPEKTPPSSTIQNLNRIRQISFQNNQLILETDNSDSLRLKNRFSLSNPSRLVVDILQSAVASKDLLKPLSYQENGKPRQIRIGQFDDETVRIVFETSKPDSIQLVYPKDNKSQLVLSQQASDTSVSTLPGTTSLGQLNDIVIGKKAGDSTIRIFSSSPIVHRLSRNGSKVTLELLNVASKAEAIPYEVSAFPELKSVRMEALNAGQPNSKLVVELGDPRVEVDVDVAADEKTMDLVLLTPSAHPTFGQVNKAPFKARVVVDAGHGGKDMGANRDGVYEKNLNLQVAHLLRAELEKRGFSVQMTRSTDIFLPLPQITAITNAANPDVFVSVHQNASTNPGLNGIETYYYTPQSLSLARAVHRKMTNAVNAPDRGVRRNMFYVIHHTHVPAILCEVGYISNASERIALQSRQRQQATANAIAEGVVEYLRSRSSALTD